MITEDSIEITQEEQSRIAQIAHETIRLYIHVFGLDEEVQPSWANAPEWMKRSARVGVQHIANNPASTPKDSHISWMNEKLSETNEKGEPDPWKWGPVKNSAKKEHPCLKPYEELPAAQRVKDRLFVAVVRSLLPDLA
jgi:hypothetical protein